jgi:hypothetical protein
MKHRIKLLQILAATLLIVVLPGCVVHEQFTFNEVDLTGPVSQTPINVTVDPKPGTVQLMPRFAVNTEQVVKGSLVPSPALSAHGQNAMWEIPRTEYGLDLQFTVTKHFGFLIGGTFASAGEDQFSDVRLGVALFSVKNNLGVRLDAGVQFNSVNYRSRSTVTTDVDYWVFGQGRYISNFDDRGSERSAGPYFALTLNTAYRESPVSGFVHAGVAWQPLLNYSPIDPDTLVGPGDHYAPTWNIKSTTAVLCFAGGVAIELGGGHRVLIGARGYQPLELDSLEPAPILQPFLQFVIGF